MKIRAIHQMLPNYWYGDAIGNAVTQTRALLQEWGYKSEVYADVIHEKLTARNFREYDSGDPASMVIYHYSTGSRVNRYVLENGRNIILMYHNVTPASFYMDYNAEAADNCLRGRDFLRRFSGKVLRAIAVSPYNAAELEEAGVRPVSVVPCLMDLKQRNPSGQNPFGDDRPNILFVGRISPNKNHEGLIKAYYFLKKYHMPQARLVLVGGYGPGDLYQKRMAALARGLGLRPDDVVFTGVAPDEVIVNYFESASLFLCMSLHEGLCIPLLEAMKFQKPVVALRATGVAGTMDGAG
ncbi:MAG: glycosyltransferase, partial [Nitrospinota bacterium]|nr:glycosyltransferase [Nitrospinota bacterium]